MNLVHRPSFRLNSALFVAFLGLSVALWQGMPERYPVHFTLRGSPTRWAEGPGMWVLLVALCSISFGKLHLFQRFLVSDPDSELLNVPYKRLFRKLPRERKVPVLRRANRLLGLMNLGLLLTFTSVLLLIWISARHPASAAAAVANHSLLLLVLGLVLLVPLLEILALRRMIRRKLVEEGLLGDAGRGGRSSEPGPQDGVP